MPRVWALQISPSHGGKKDISNHFNCLNATSSVFHITFSALCSDQRCYCADMGELLGPVLMLVCSAFPEQPLEPGCVPSELRVRGVGYRDRKRRRKFVGFFGFFGFFLWLASYSFWSECCDPDRDATSQWTCMILPFQWLAQEHRKKCSLFACLQIPALPSHCGAVLPELLAAHQWRVGHGCGGTPNLERRAASHGPDQMGLSAAVWLIPFLLVKVYHSYGTMDSARPLGSVCSGFIPGGESLKITWTWEPDVEVCFIQWITERYEIPPLAMEHES